MSREQYKQVIIKPEAYGFQGLNLIADVYYKIKGDRVEISNAMFVNPEFRALNAFINTDQLECQLTTSYRINGAL